jgi:hypothetical protein
MLILIIILGVANILMLAFCYFLYNSTCIELDDYHKGNLERDKRLHYRIDECMSEVRRLKWDTKNNEGYCKRIEESIHKTNDRISFLDKLIDIKTK